MTVAKPMTEHRIRATCRAMIAAGVQRAYRTALADLEGLEKRPGLEAAGPVMVAVFSESIEQGCAALGAVEDGLPDVARFEPNERAFALLPAMVPVEARIEARRIHRVMARRVREFIAARAAGEIDRADAVYRQIAESAQIGNFVFMLWATALIVRRYVDAAATLGRACPTCRDGVLQHLTPGEPATYTCGHREQLSDTADPAAFQVSRQKMWDQVATILGGGDGR